MVGELTSKYSPYLRQYFLPLLLGFLGLIFLGYGLIQYFRPKADKEDILFEAASTADSTGSSGKQSAQQKLIAVDVEGAVEKPDVYKIS